MGLKHMIQSAANALGYGIVRREVLDAIQRPVAETIVSLPPLRPSVLRAVAPASANPNAARAAFDDGVKAQAEGDDQKAFSCFARSIAIIPHYEPAVVALRKMAAESYLAARTYLDRGDDVGALPHLVKALEMDRHHGAARRSIDDLIARRGNKSDLTKMCFIFYDGDRARAIHGEAFRRALEYVTIGGVIGDVLEFGVLGGWSARLLCEIMRDIGNYADIHLFDSFDGLPEYATEVDRTSYEIGARDLWSDKMRFPQDFLARFDAPHEQHIAARLAEIIRPERIFINKGFYADVLKRDLSIKAALIHIDCDLYQSTEEVLTGLHRMKALQDGCVVLFDDWNCNRANPDFGERRAFREFLERQSDYTASPWFTYGYNGAAFLLHARR